MELRAVGCRHSDLVPQAGGGEQIPLLLEREQFRLFALRQGKALHVVDRFRDGAAPVDKAVEIVIGNGHQPAPAEDDQQRRQREPEQKDRALVDRFLLFALLCLLRGMGLFLRDGHAGLAAAGGK